MSVTKSNNISATRTVKMTTTPKNKDVKLLFKMGVPKLQRRSKSIKQIIKLKKSLATRNFYESSFASLSLKKHASSATRVLPLKCRTIKLTWTKSVKKLGTYL